VDGLFFLKINKKGEQMKEIEIVTSDIRSIVDKGIRYFPVVDLIKALNVSDRPNKYWRDMQVRENTQLSAICGKFKFKANNGKKYEMDCVTLEGAFRLIQSIPSQKVEPLKLALARIASERIEEMQNPELGIKRAKARAVQTYRSKGMTDDWISERLLGIDDRHTFTDLLKKDGVTNPMDYAQITAQTHVASFGLTPRDHKDLKGLEKSQKLRDNMVRAELRMTRYSEGFLSMLLEDGVPREEALKKHAEHIQKTREDSERIRGSRLATKESPIKKIELTKGKK
jgi:hypothetical protein